MNVINKMVVIPEKEYILLKNHDEKSDNVKPLVEQTTAKTETNSQVENKFTELDLNEIKTSFKEAVQKYEEKLSKRPKRPKRPKSGEQTKKCQKLKWTNVKNF